MKKISFLLTASTLILLGTAPLFAATYTVSNNNDSGAGSLRQAITDANANAGIDEIVFDANYTIQPSSQLPNITEGVNINTSSTKTIHLTGDSSINYGLPIVGGSSTQIKNLTVESFGTAGIYVDNADYVTVEACFLYNNNSFGIDVTDSSAYLTFKGNVAGSDNGGYRSSGNQDVGVRSQGGNALIGGPTTADRNIMVGHRSNGINLVNSSNDRIENNYVGVSPSGLAAVPNRVAGILINGTSNTAIIDNVSSGNVGSNLWLYRASNVTVEGNYLGLNANGTGAIASSGTFAAGLYCLFANGCQIGGSTANQRNYISGLNGPGQIGIFLLYSGSLEANYIQNNYIGTTASGDYDVNLVNGYGIVITETKNTIIEDCLISYNNGSSLGIGGSLPIVSIDGFGIGFYATTTESENTGNTFRRNRTFSNSGKAISLSNTSTTYPGNSGIAAPVFNSSSFSSSTLTGTAPANATVEIFESSGAAGSQGEGRSYLGAATADSSGNFSYSLSSVTTTTTYAATATASNNTSEFSNNAIVSVTTTTLPQPQQTRAVITPGSNSTTPATLNLDFESATPGSARLIIDDLASPPNVLIDQVVTFSSGNNDISVLLRSGFGEKLPRGVYRYTLIFSDGTKTSGKFATP